MRRLIAILALLLASCSTKHIGLEGYATRTTAELHLYADGTSGDDANDGLTAGTPKKTLAAVVAAAPTVATQALVFHLSGTFSEPGDIWWERPRAAAGSGTSSRMIIDGGDSWTDVGLGVLTATGSSTTSLVVAGAVAGSLTLTPDTWCAC